MAHLPVQKGGKIGTFEMADGGTIFLDEIGDMELRDASEDPPCTAGAGCERVGRVFTEKN